MQQYSLTGLDADRLAVAQHAPVDGKGTVADLIAMRVAPTERCRHRRFAFRLQVGVLSAGQEIAGHVSTAAERWLKFLERQEDFLVVGAGVLFGFDIDRANQAAVLAARQVRSRNDVGVVEAESGRAGHERDAPHAVCGM